MTDTMRIVRSGLVALAVFVAGGAMAFPAIPKESAKSLGITKGKQFSSGVVFVNGKYVAPPYVVERWGTGIRINSKRVTGQVIDWTEFLKTQSGVKTTTTQGASRGVEAVTSATPKSAAAAPSASTDSDDSSLDDLFDDDSSAKKKSAAKSSAGARPKAPKSTVTYSLEGDFVPNEASKALVGKINAARTNIDRILRSGGFICFGDNYTQVTGDRRTLMEMLDKLPEIMQHSNSSQEFVSKVRAASMVYLNEVLCEDLYRNRVDYRRLQELRTKLKKENQLNNALNTRLF